MPTKKAIKDHWASQLVEMGKFDSFSEVHEADYCFACGFLAKTQRAHILARADGGVDSRENIHLLCRACHCQSEMLSNEGYWDWFNNGPYGLSGLIKRAMEQTPEKVTA